jgi:hypothetical protein
MSRELENTMRSRLFLLVFPVLLALAAPAFARETLDSILPQIRAAHPGRLSDAEPFIGNDGRTHYRIKWMTPEGRILYFDADAHSGRYSSFGGDGQWRGGGEGGGQWRGGDEHRSRGGDDGQFDSGADRGHHDNWNGGPGDFGGGDWRDRRGGGDWDRHNGGGWGGGRGGDWRGGHGGGDNGGHHHGGH